MADDEVGWVFTAYIAAGAAVMPMARWLAGRYGRKTIYQVSLAIFSLGLVLDTLATTSIQMVLARIVQGAASGPLAVLSMAILLDVLPPARHARISLAWTICVLVGISSGAGIGGWLSEYHGWHSIFYFSLPMAGFIFARYDRPADGARPRRAAGMVWVGGNLGRSDRLDAGILLFIVHVLTRDVHFLNKALFRDRNFVISTIMVFAVGFVLLPTLALTSPMLEGLLNYPVDTTGYMTIPRGVTLVAALVLMNFVPAQIDSRLFVIGGTSLVVYANC
jgi:MFS transporter, DHA2 family, multidrug resistance protein